VEWAQKKRQSVTAQALEYLRDQIEAGRAAGVSWPRIAETVNETLGTSIHAATIRSYFSAQKITDKEQEQIEKTGSAAVDLSAHKPEPKPVPKAPAPKPD